MGGHRVAIVGALILIVGGCVGRGPVGADPSSPGPSSAALESAVLVGASSRPVPSGTIPSDRPSAGPSTSPTPDASQAVVGDPPIDIQPTPARSVALTIQEIQASGMGIRVPPNEAATVHLVFGSEHLDVTGCSITHAITPDAPGSIATTESLPVVPIQAVIAVDGRHEFRASCRSTAATLVAEASLVVMDGAPERCAGWVFTETASTVTSVDQLEAGMVGSWEGCLTTPWLPPYWVSLTFRSDGTYSSTVGEVIDSFPVPALYYGTDADSPMKRWRVDDVLARNVGSGVIDVVFDSATVVEDELRRILLMGDTLQIEMMHAGQYGPLVFELRRT